MGVDAALIDAALKVGPGQPRRLTRDEIARFGIMPRTRYETSWMSAKDQSGRPFVQKAVTEPATADSTSYQTSVVRAWCRYKGWIVLSYQRAAQPDEGGVLFNVRAATGDSSVGPDEAIAATTIFLSHVFTSLDFFDKAIAAGHTTFTESFSPRQAAAWSRVIEFSTAGLAPLLSDWPKQCMES